MGSVRLSWAMDCVNLESLQLMTRHFSISLDKESDKYIYVTMEFLLLLLVYSAHFKEVFSLLSQRGGPDSHIKGVWGRYFGKVKE